VGITADYAATANSDVVVITSGVPRKPGMTREELIGVNAGIVKSVMGEAIKFSPNAIFLIVSNPMDTMTYLALKSSGLPSSRVFGMGGQLDSARFRCYLSRALGASMSDIDGMVIGGHGDTTMIPLIDKAAYRGIPVSKFASKEVLDKVVADTMVGGATLTALLGTSAWYAPGAAAASVVEAIMFDQKKVIPSCVALNGEYGQNDICIGVPVVIGRGGAERVLEIELSADEAAKFAKSADAVRGTNAVLKEIGVL
jgi:malate dehydrogenase